MAAISTQPAVKFLSLKTSRLMIGFFAVSSQPMAPKMPMKARRAMMTMKGEPNQSSSSPRSITTCRQPRPSAIRPSPMKSMLLFFLTFSFSHGGS